MSERLENVDRFCPLPTDEDVMRDTKEADRVIYVDKKSENILEEADRIIHADRNKDYGHPADNHGTTAAFWNVYLNAKMCRPGSRSDPLKQHILDAEDVCWFNVLQKISREVTTGAGKRDTLVDVAGYTGNVEMIRDRNGGLS